ncbi:hypothetical protein bcgnr5372_37660 [Bacillus luti]|nr:hypothetical protein [Bacillus cereus]HDR8337232.1 hypothetical protein [Bacillus cereus]
MKNITSTQEQLLKELAAIFILDGEKYPDDTVIEMLQVELEKEENLAIIEGSSELKEIKSILSNFDKMRETNDPNYEGTGPDALDPVFEILNKLNLIVD